MKARTLILALTCLALSTVAPSQLVVQPPVAAGPTNYSGPANQTATYEPLGADGNGTTSTAVGGAVVLTAGSPSNNPGNYFPLGTTSNAWCGFWVSIAGPGSSTNRYMIDIRSNSSTIVTNLYAMPGTTGHVFLYVPVKVSIGAAMDARVRSSGATSTIKVSLVGAVDASTCPPGYNSMFALTALDTVTTRLSTVNVPIGTATTWTPIAPSTGAASAFYVALGSASVVAATIQMTTVSIATGSSGSEVEVARYNQQNSGSSGAWPNTYSPLFNRAIAGGAPISARVLGATTADSVAVNLYGLN